jgi:hypothetical protein
MRQPEQPTTADAEIAIQRGDAATLGRLIKLADGDIPGIAEIIFVMLSSPDGSIPDIFKLSFVLLDPDLYADRLGLKWRLIVKPCGGGRPPHGEMETVRARCLDLLQRDSVTGLRLMADLFDPMTGSAWRLAFKRVVPSHKPGRPVADEAAQTLRAMAIVHAVSVALDEGAETIDEAVKIAGTSRSEFYRARKKLRKT